MDLWNVMNFRRRIYFWLWSFIELALSAFWPVLFLFFCFLLILEIVFKLWDEFTLFILWGCHTIHIFWRLSLTPPMFLWICRRLDPRVISRRFLRMLTSPLRLIYIHYVMIFFLKWLFFIKLFLNFLSLSLQMPNQQLLWTWLGINWNFPHVMLSRKLLVRSSRPILISKILHRKFMISLPSNIELCLYIVQIRLIYRRLIVLSHQESFRDAGNMVLVHLFVR